MLHPLQRLGDTDGCRRMHDHSDTITGFGTPPSFADASHQQLTKNQIELCL